MEQLLLTNRQAPGDILMFTCALRDLQEQFPGRYLIEVESTAASLSDTAGAPGGPSR